MRHGSCCGSRGRGHGSRVAAAIACAKAAAAAVAAAAAARTTAGGVTAMAAARQLLSEPASQPRQRPTHPVRFPSERGAVARGEQCVRGCFGAVPALCCLARRALDATSAASNEVAGGGGSEYPAHAADCSGRARRARRAAAQGIYSGHAAAGSEAQDEPSGAGAACSADEDDPRAKLT